MTPVRGKHRGRGWVQRQTPRTAPLVAQTGAMPLTFGGVPMLYHKLGTPLLIVSKTSAWRTLTPGLSCGSTSYRLRPLSHSVRQLLVRGYLATRRRQDPAGRIGP
ncbi:MAG: hypothetical protein N2112_04720 [Gemmataceae bacterium]|nr:hypothetical protein [Gemmataceae bacterium]